MVKARRSPRVTVTRILDGVRWRTEVLLERLPPRARVWVKNYRSDRGIRRGQTAYERQRLVRTFRELLRLLMERRPDQPLGDYLEFGVYHGTSLSCMYAARESLGLGSVRLFGFDSFEGLPESAAREDDGVWAPGEFRSPMRLTLRTLARFGVPSDAFTLVPGWFSDTCTPETRARLGLEQASVLMIDCDLYSSTRQALDFSEPLIGAQAVLVFDDWGAGALDERRMGEARAFEEFLAAHPDLRAEEIEGLDYKDKADPRIFLVTRV